VGYKKCFSAYYIFKIKNEIFFPPKHTNFAIIMLQSNSQSRANILQKIEDALQQKTPMPFNHNLVLNNNVVQQTDEPLLTLFSENLTGLLGNVIISKCQSNTVDQLKLLCQNNNWQKVYCVEENIINQCLANNWEIEPYNDLATCDVSITSCEFLVARTGSIMLSSALPQGRTASVYAPVHICVAYQRQLVFDVKDAFISLDAKYGKNIPSSISLATGPSRTADIEKTLVVGVHGPKEVYCIIES
jgi:L-lactate dehydrogenase complex protein LldG